MSTVTLNKEHETGNELLDHQHRLFIEKINNCIDASRNGSSREHLTILLHDILKCLLEHLRHEEKIMLEEGLLSSTHLSQHFSIIRRLEKQISTFRMNDEKEKLSVQFILFSLYEWYMNHLQTEDTCFQPTP